jgi:integration host factor subunit beta
VSLGINKSDLVIALQKDLKLPIRKSEEVVDTMFNLMARTLVNGNRMEIRGFGSFIVKDYPGYTGRNPATGELITVADKRLPFFKAGKDLKERIDET